MDKLILGLPYLAIEKIESHNPPVIQARLDEPPVCPHCGGTHLRTKDSFMRTLRSEPLRGFSLCTIKLLCHKYKCLECNKYFNTRIPSVLPWSRTTETLKRNVFMNINRGVSGKAVAADLGIGVASVERYYQQMIEYKDKQYSNRLCPQVLGIDEHRFTRKVGLVTTFCDLNKQRIFDVVQGKKAADMVDYLQSLQGRELVRVVCIDMCTTYRSLVKQWFPNAKIVCDRFHVIRLVNQQFSEICKSIDTHNLPYGRGRLMRLLVKRRDTLSEEQQTRLDDYFEMQPAIKALYDFMHDLNDLLRLKKQNTQQCKIHIPKFLKAIQELKNIDFEPLQTLGKTLYTWRNEVACMFRFSKNNGITEGFHRKMKLIQRRAYGFVNFENYRLRVRVLCS